MSRLAFLALLAVWMAIPGMRVEAANTVEWESVPLTASEQFSKAGECKAYRITASNAANESRLLYIGGGNLTIQSEADAQGAGTGPTADLFACSSSDGNRDGTQDTLACAALNFFDSDADGVADDNTLDGGATAGRRGLLTPLAVAGFLYADPITAPTGNVVMEITACVVR